jgi:rhodanese-related sulfurtransferase
MTRFVSTGVIATCVVAATTFAADHTTDTLNMVKSTVADGKAVLIDVREVDEWKEGHLKDARHLALSEIKTGVPADKLKEKLPAGRVVYLHCAAGGRCRIAADHLKKLGYDVRPLKDGYDSLLDAGFEKAK